MSKIPANIFINNILEKINLTRSLLLLEFDTDIFYLSLPVLLFVKSLKILFFSTASLKSLTSLFLTDVATFFLL